MEEKVLSGIGGIGMYGVISICIFFGFFTGMLVWAFLLKKSHVASMGALPLDDATPGGNDRNPNHFDKNHDL